jgi:hypothetical protein
MHNHKPVPESGPPIGGPDGPQPDNAGQPQPSHSMWWMVACCAPMVLIALAILLGVFGPR